jgi:hypothetical protein
MFEGNPLILIEQIKCRRIYEISSAFELLLCVADFRIAGMARSYRGRRKKGSYQASAVSSISISSLT